VAVKLNTARNILAAMGTDRDKWWTAPEMIRKAHLGFWGSARLYPALGWLEDHGHVEAQFGEDGRRRYRITTFGYCSLLRA
jgi:hypothetical protein